MFGKKKRKKRGSYKKTFKIHVNSKITEDQAKKLLQFCMEKDWTESQAIRNIIFWFFEDRNKILEDTERMLNDLWEEQKDKTGELSEGVL